LSNLIYFALFKFGAVVGGNCFCGEGGNFAAVRSVPSFEECECCPWSLQSALAHHLPFVVAAAADCAVDVVAEKLMILFLCV
jgi:hypothetical protein